MQLVFSWAPKLAKSVRVNIGFPVVRTDGRSVYGHVITKFSGMGRFTKLWGSAHARASRARRAPELRGAFTAHHTNILKLVTFNNKAAIVRVTDLKTTSMLT